MDWMFRHRDPGMKSMAADSHYASISLTSLHFFASFAPLR